MAESVMLDKAKDFAVEIINMCRNIKETKRESVLTNQLMRSGTSIGANIHESKYAHGTADFISKMQILGIDINPTSYSKLEGQVRLASDREVYVSAKILNVNIEELFENEAPDEGYSKIK